MSSPQKSKILPKKTTPYFDRTGPTDSKPSNSSKSTNGPQASLRLLTLLLLPPIGFLGFYLLHVLGYTGGLLKIISDVGLESAPLFQGSKTPLLLHLTGINAIDTTLKHLVTFFAPVVDYRSPKLTLFWFHMIGQFGASSALLLLEASRVGNRWSSANWVGLLVYGVLVQLRGWALMTPFYLFLHTLTSPLGKPISPTNPSSNVFVSKADMTALPVSVVFGCIVPGFLLMLSPRLLSPVMQQVVAAIWQPFPIYLILSQFVLRTLLGASEQTPTAASYLPSARQYYNFIMLFCMAMHIPITAITLLSPSIFGTWSPSLAAVASLSFADVFIPPAPLRSWRMVDFADGVHVFLQWDTYISALASTLWATMILRNASTESSASLYPRILARMVMFFVLAGPFGPVVDLLRQRDEITAKKIKQ